MITVPVVSTLFVLLCSELAAVTSFTVRSRIYHNPLTNSTDRNSMRERAVMEIHRTKT